MILLKWWAPTFSVRLPGCSEVLVFRADPAGVEELGIWPARP